MKNGNPGTPVKTKKFVCTHCRHGQCVECTDLMRAKANLGRICECPRHKTT